MKKGLKMVFVQLLLCSVLIAGSERKAVSAAEATEQVTVVEYRGAESSFPEADLQEADVLFNRKEARGETAPVHYWDLSEKPYEYTLPDVTDYTITNFSLNRMQTAVFRFQQSDWMREGTRLRFI